MCNTIDNHNRKSLPNRFWQAWSNLWFKFIESTIREIQPILNFNDYFLTVGKSTLLTGTFCRVTYSSVSISSRAGQTSMCWFWWGAVSEPLLKSWSTCNTARLPWWPMHPVTIYYKNKPGLKRPTLCFGWS